MKSSKLVVAIFAYATITFCSAYYISTKEVTSAVLVDKAKHSLDLTTNGLHNISISEAFTIDKSEAAQINFLRCSFARPEFRFSWFCHQQKIDGKMTKNSYVALKDDQQKYFRENVIKSVAYEGRKWAQQAEQLSTFARIQSSHEKVNEKAKASGVNGEAKSVESVEQGGRELMEAGTQVIIGKNISDFRKNISNSPLGIDPITEFSNFSIKYIERRFIDSESPSAIKDFGILNYSGKNDPLAKINDGLIDAHLVLIFLLSISIGIAVAAYDSEGDLKQKVKVLRKRRYKLLRTAKPFSKEAAEIRELDIKIEELDNKIAKLKDEVKGENHE
ncbi:hypothetical protein EJ576_21735 [Pseudomonas sp. C 49-2]|uniref:hypothetical protein n=1 Tax=Pseudomonas sp. C 49-2 TaxID=2496849 RepID=UPI000F81C49F|nr:hypothetical protein [Pseudomonas sp. C 49-2]RTX96349.1 hypothetical protein EJ576_21735 [Pseudomonas sp. C 49-2]